jgi:malonyl-CoA O-methyltransferase
MDAYAAWAPGYPPYAHNPLMEVEQAAVLALLPPVAGRRVLDAGCGTGRYLQILDALGARVVGVDLSAAMIARARPVSPRLLRADMSALPLAAGCCDVVVSGLAVIDIEMLDRVAAEWARVLCHRGVVVYSTVHPVGRELGWQRTYLSDGMPQSLPAHWHSLEDQRRACATAGLDIEAIDEPALMRGGPSVAMVIRARRK